MVGAGAWGTAVAALCASNAPTTLCGRDRAHVDRLRTERLNVRHHPGVELPASLEFETETAQVTEAAGVVFLAVPTSAIRAVASELAASTGPSTTIVSLAKGFDSDSRQRISELIESVLPGRPVAVLTGPNIAREVLAGHPSAAVVAAHDSAVAERVRGVVVGPTFRVYTNTDVVGSEVGGAVKNIIAIAAGVAEGLGFGHNTRAALITRGLAEMSRLGEVLGADPATFAGLAGLGDLVVTCASPDSRNHRAGVLYADGATTTQIERQLDHLPEGVRAASIARELGRSHGIDLPITAAVASLIEDGSDPRAVLRDLLERPYTTE